MDETGPTRIGKMPSAVGMEARRRRIDVSLSAAHATATAVDGLYRRDPRLSAQSGVSPSQAAGLRAILGASLVFLWQTPESLWAGFGVIIMAFFAALIFLRLSATVMTLLRRRIQRQPAAEPPDLSPSFTLLVPLFQEEDVAAQSVEALANLDYPADRLQVLYLVEAGDTPTINALHDAIGGLPFDIVVVPDKGPRTKPKALNFGLSMAVGEIITVYDAEDVPNPGQLRAAASAFALADEKLAVVQAPLHVHNSSSSWIAGQFDLEYRVHFDIWLPALTLIDCPIPLGGTSNHFRAGILRQSGAWDAFNVTEDADLGIRLARMGYQAGMIDPPTLEEAPERLSQWVAQRSRWIKGHLQTWLVLMRRPFSAIHSLGVGRFTLLQATFGASLMSSLLHGPIAIWLVFAAFSSPGQIELPYLIFLSTGYLSALFAVVASRSNWTVIQFLTMPAYWVLMSVAAVRALWELFRSPYSWAKTRHGLTAAPAVRPARR